MTKNESVMLVSSFHRPNQSLIIFISPLYKQEGTTWHKFSPAPDIFVINNLVYIYLILWFSSNILGKTKFSAHLKFYILIIIHCRSHLYSGQFIYYKHNITEERQERRLQSWNHKIDPDKAKLEVRQQPCTESNNRKM